VVVDKPGHPSTLQQISEELSKIPLPFDVSNNMSSLRKELSMKADIVTLLLL
jgi:hypothetical protein